MVTPGLSFNDNVLDRKQNNFPASLFKTKDKCGVAFLDVSTGEFYAAQGNENYVLKLIQGFAPSEIIGFSRLGRRELMRFEVSVQDIVQTIVDERKSIEDDRPIEIKIKKLPNAFADLTTLRQVWINLASNALKYSRDRERSIVEIGSFEKDRALIYYIKDNGAGFDMKYYDKLFGVFQRLHSQKEFEGTGVRLAIVQRIIAKHGGKIWAEAKLNEGATFYFTLSAMSSSAVAVTEIKPQIFYRLGLDTLQDVPTSCAFIASRTAEGKSERFDLRM